MSARDRILAAARRQIPETDANRAATAAERLRSRVQTSLVPEIARLSGEERVQWFINQAEAVHTTVSRIGAVDELPEALSSELRNRNLPQSVRLGEDSAFDGLEWGMIETSSGKGRVFEPATLSRAFAGSAETGTLVLTSGADNPVTLTFLGETHFVVVRASEIQAGMEGVWKELRASGRDPRTVNFVTGPSRTGDIESKLELGAHGPIALHVFVVDS
ncbi:MAG: LUD domain-containing protein [Pseudomonadota bacterium]